MSEGGTLEPEQAREGLTRPGTSAGFKAPSLAACDFPIALTTQYFTSARRPSGTPSGHDYRI